MPLIHVLSPHVADLIAAGEVVERPASAVKELLENAVDAGARTVVLELRAGGRDLIRVSDDGSGMAPEDAGVCFLRHATSKLSDERGLEALGTLGFRGEALAAISAVSRIDLMTCRPGDECGTALHLEAGVVTDNAPAGCPAGTTIVVRDLFFNTPARMKFMKRDSAEGAACFSVVQQQALAHPEIAFRFLRDGAELLSTPGDGELKSAVYCVLGRQTAADMLAVSSRWEQYAVSGFISRPTAARGNRNYQHFFVNGRYVKSKLLTAALEEAYRNQLMQGRFPACVLHLTLPVTQVDVNVHPAKTEVKFLSERAVFDCVRCAALGVLDAAPGRPEMRLKPPAAPAQKAPPEKKDDFFRRMPAGEYASLAEKPKAPAPPVRVPQTQAAFRTAVPAWPSELEPQASVHEQVQLVTPRPAPKAPAPEPEPAQTELPVPTAPYRIVGEVLQTYIIVEQDGKVLFIDKHAAHERVLFEKLRATRASVMSQVLIEPIAAELDREEAAALLESAELLREYGYEVEEFGGGSVLIRQIPSDIDAGDAVSALSGFASALMDSRALPAEERRDHLLHTVACKSAIKAGWITQPEEISALVREVLTRGDIKYCPHGRPVCITLTEGQLERQFGRA